MPNTYRKSGVTLQDGIIDNSNPQQCSANLQNTNDYVNSDRFQYRLYSNTYKGCIMALAASSDGRIVNVGEKLDYIRQLAITQREIILSLKALADQFNDIASQLLPYAEGAALKQETFSV